MSRWLAIAPLVVLAVLAAVFVGWSLKRDPTYRPDALVGRPLPEAALHPLVGGEAGPDPVSIRALTGGRPAVVNLFASWCAPCRVEHPNLSRFRAAGVPVIGVAYKDAPVASRAFLDELGDPYEAVVLDPEGRFGLDLGLSGVPETFAVDARGVIVAKASGPLVTPQDADRLIQALR